MDLSTAIGLRSEGRQIQAGAPKQDSRYNPVHAGAHAHLTNIGYIHTGNKVRGGITTSNYFKRKSGNSRNIAVQKDGSYVKTATTAKGTRRSRGKLNADGMKHDPLHQDDAYHEKGTMVNAAPDAAKPDHLAEYSKLMKESASHQRIADGLAQ